MTYRIVAENGERLDIVEQFEVERELLDEIFGKRDKRTGKAPKLPFKYARRFHD